MLANLPILSSAALLASALAVQAFGSLGGNVHQWLQASEAELVAHVGTAPPVAPSSLAPQRSRGAVGHVERAGDGLFYVSGKANAAPVRFLIDTGSTATILTRSDAARIGLDVAATGSGRRARTLAGEVRITQVRLHDLHLAGRRFTDLKIGVASDDLGVSLIGQDVLRRFDSLVIEKDGASLR